MDIFDLAAGLGNAASPAAEAAVDHTQSQRRQSFDEQSLRAYNSALSPLMRYQEKPDPLFKYFSDLGLTRQEMQKALFQAYKEKVNG